MELEYRGAYRNHGLHTIHCSDKLRRAGKGQWASSDKESVLANVTSDGIVLRFDGTGNLNTNANYEFIFRMSDQDLLDLFEMKFGLQMTVLDIKKELFGEYLKRNDGPSPRIPSLPPPA